MFEACPIRFGAHSCNIQQIRLTISNTHFDHTASHLGSHKLLNRLRYIQSVNFLEQLACEPLYQLTPIKQVKRMLGML